MVRETKMERDKKAEEEERGSYTLMRWQWPDFDSAAVSTLDVDSEVSGTQAVPWVK